MIRSAGTADLAVLRALWEDFQREVPEPDYVDVDPEAEVAEIAAIVEGGGALVAEQEGETVGYALVELRWPRVGFLTDLYVRESGRRQGVAAALLRAAVELLRGRGATHVQLDVLASNGAARAVYERWGFRTEELKLVAELDALEGRLAPRAAGRSYGAVHVQTDDRAAVERAVAKQLPRLGRSERTEISEPHNGWTTVHDELCDREPKLLQRLARELSYATAAVVLALGVEHGAVVRYTLFERGGAVDEYLSVPEYYGPLPPGDVVALGANPTVVARLTGADPVRIRAVAATAGMPGALPPAGELLREIAAAMGVEGAGGGPVGF